MPFDFTGTQPALLGAVGVPKKGGDGATSSQNPFSTSLAGSTPSFGASSTFSVPPSVGAFPSFGASPSFGTSLPFGRVVSPWSAPKGIACPQAQPPTNRDQTTEQAQTSRVGQDVLSKALGRAALQRPAILGATDRGADDVLKEYGEHLQQYQITKGLPTLSEELETLAQQYPQTAAFVHFLFQRSARLQGERPHESLKQAKIPARLDAEEEENSNLREVLLPAIHERLVAFGLAKDDRSSDGYLKDGQSRVYCQVALESKSYDTLMIGLHEEYLGDKGQAFLDFAQWLWDEVSRLRIEHDDDVRDKREMDQIAAGWPKIVADNTPRTKSMLAASILAQKPEADPLSAFLGKADADGRLAAKLKKESNAEPAYSGLDYNAGPGGKRCCEKTTKRAVHAKKVTSSADKHKLLSEGDTKLLKAWLCTKLRNLAELDADEEVLAEFILTYVKLDRDEATVKASCEEALQEFLGSGAKCLIDGLFEAIATRAYDPNFAKLERDAEVKPTSYHRRTTRGTEPHMPFRMLDLPAELRTWIYREVLVPGTVTLLSCKHGNPFGVAPLLTTGLLATCRQVNNEAKGLIFENTFIADAWPASKLMIKPKLIPHHVLPQLTSLTLMLAIASHHDFRQMQAMTKLKEIRICGHENEKMDDAHHRDFVKDILESVPANCVVAFGPRTLEEAEHYHKAHEMIDPSLATTLQAIAEGVEKEVVKGSKSGTSGLFYFDSAGALRHM